jgi:bifunctional aspartokinase / homoserine dehydrogenase 1
MKFGGSCLQNSNSFSQAFKIITKYARSSKIITVTSAIKGITDKLIEFYQSASLKEKDTGDVLKNISEFHKNILNGIISSNSSCYDKTFNFIEHSILELREIAHVVPLLKPSDNIKDLIFSYGEKLSTFIFSQFLNSKGFDCRFISSEELIITDDNFGNALPLLKETCKLMNENLNPTLGSKENHLICITGFYGATKNHNITTLGRGGSDLTAALIGYCLRKKYNPKIIYWKDVKGFLNADPQISEKTQLLKRIAYIEAKELAFFGSKVLHPLCLDISEKGCIPSEIRPFDNFESPEFTTIIKDIDKSDKIVKAIASIKRLTMVTVESNTMISLPGTAAKLFNLLENHKINVIFVSQSSSENNITFGIHWEDTMTVSSVLRHSDWYGKQWFDIKIEKDISLISIIGSRMLHTPGIAGKIFTTLGNHNINVRAIAKGSSELNITAIVRREDLEKAVNVLYDAFI